MTKTRDLADLGGGFIQAGTGAEQRTVESKLQDVVSVKDFGAVGDGVTDDAPEIQAAINYSIANNKALYFPEGIYLIDGTGLTNNRLEPTITNNSSIVLFGAGPGKTIIKEKNASVLNLGANHYTLYFNIPASTTVNNLIVRDMTLDKNGASNGSEPSSYAWEQAHIIRVNVDSTSTLRYVNFQNLELLDKVGAGIAFVAGRVLNAEVHNCHARNFSALFGQRGDFEFQASVDNLSFMHCSGLYAQSEPNVAPPAGVKPNATIRNCVIDSLEFTGFSSDPTLQSVVIDSCVANNKLTIRNSKVIATNSRFQVNSGTSAYWSRVAPGSVVSNCTIINEYDSGANSISSFYPRSEATGGGFYLTIKDSNFVPGDGASGTTTGTAIKNSAVYAGEQPYVLRLIDCTFSPLYQQTLDAYRNGIYSLVRCKIAGWGSQAIAVGGETTRYGQVTLESCDFSQVTATKLVAITNSNALWRLVWRGSHDYATYSHSTTSGTNLDLYTSFEGLFISSSAPAANGIKGMRVRISSPTEGNASEYVCTVSSATTATFRMSQQFGQKKNTTANRPTLTASDIGALHLDTTLDPDGKPIWWTGTAWVDATGAVV